MPNSHCRDRIGTIPLLHLRLPLIPGGGIPGGPLGCIPGGGIPGGGIPGGGMPRPIMCGGMPGGGIPSKGTTNNNKVGAHAVLNTSYRALVGGCTSEALKLHGCKGQVQNIMSD